MEKIIFIDDDSDIRTTYEISMRMMFSSDFEIISLDVKASLEEMISILNEIPNKVTFFIDEKLKHSGIASYNGVELAERIRFFDSKIPIYILTSYSDEIEKYLGDIEFVIDKNDWDVETESDNLLKRFLRHINTYKDIKSTQVRRFEFLLEKSLFSALSEEELEEYKSLDLSRVKCTPNERIISEESLKRLNSTSEELNRIYDELKKNGL
ncbi:hypothetical protein [Pantoea ananatis]|uniref:hypothetical protein n=1 Tax=Pantoea ananas TaxID=553 RepID=UPI001303916D|nr:hypothetical protein [Pantoea ananatis]NQE78025.1 hypothetical protein [Pantoea ananatis]NQE83489.1 hypothetical protein [Pantoea ananatis]